MKPPCSVDGCEKPVHSKGYCQAHYRLNRKYGSPTVLPKDRRKKPGPKPSGKSPKPKLPRAAPRTHVRTRPQQTDAECAQGHPWSDDTLYLYPNGKRHCRYCAYVSQCKHEDRDFAPFEEWLQDRQRRALYCPSGHLWSEHGRTGPSTGHRVCTACQGNSQRKLKYGLEPERYQEWLEEQGHACAICEVPFTAKLRPHVDHDHSCCPDHAKSCGKCVRGLLCSSCNNGLGRFNDDPDILRKAADYLVAPRVV